MITYNPVSCDGNAGGERIMTTRPFANISLICGIALIYAFAAPDAKAGSITYTYTGNDFNIIVGTPGVTTSDFISITATFANPLPDQSIISDTPDSWSITDGVNTITSSTPSVTYASFAFAASNGTIEAWGIHVNTDTENLESYSSGAYSDEFFYDLSHTIGGGPSNYGENNIGVGSWTESSATPEPSSMALLLLGLVCWN